VEAEVPKFRRDACHSAAGCKEDSVYDSLVEALINICPLSRPESQAEEGEIYERSRIRGVSYLNAPRRTVMHESANRIK
jgi:hypothetical protein